MAHKVHAYIRTSTTDQTLEQQETAIRESYPEGTEIEIYQEQLSGWSGKRPEYELLKKLISRNKVKELVVFSISRLGRHVQEAADLLTLCQRHSVKVRVLKENLDFGGPMGFALFMLFSALAQMDSDTKSQAVKVSFRLKEETEGWKCHGSPPHTVTQKIKDKSETIYALHASENTCKYISKMLDLSEKVVSKVIKMKGYPLLTRKEYAELFPGWHLMKKEDLPSLEDIKKKWEEKTKAS